MIQEKVLIDLLKKLKKEKAPRPKRYWRHKLLPHTIYIYIY